MDEKKKRTGNSYLEEGLVLKYQQKIAILDRKFIRVFVFLLIFVIITTQGFRQSLFELSFPTILYQSILAIATFGGFLGGIQYLTKIQYSSQTRKISRQIIDAEFSDIPYEPIKIADLDESLLGLTAQLKIYVDNTDESWKDQIDEIEVQIHEILKIAVETGFREKFRKRIQEMLDVGIPFVMLYVWSSVLYELDDDEIQALRDANKALELAEKRNAALKIASLWSKSSILLRQEKYDEAQQLIEDKVTYDVSLFTSYDHPYDEKWSRYWNGRCLNKLGSIIYENYDDIHESSEFYKLAYSEFSTIEDQLRVAIVYSNQGIQREINSEPYAAIEKYNSALGIIHELENIQPVDKEFKAVILTNLSIVTATLGKLDEALGLIETALKYREEVDSEFGMARSKFSIAILYFKMGNHDEARNYLENALEVCRNHDKLEYVVGILFQLIRVYVHLEMDETAAIYLNELEEVAHSNKLGPESRSIEFHELASAIMMKREPTFENLAKSKKILNNLIPKFSQYPEMRILAIINLCELYILEYYISRVAETTIDFALTQYKLILKELNGVLEFKKKIKSEYVKV